MEVIRSDVEICTLKVFSQRSRQKSVGGTLTLTEALHERHLKSARRSMTSNGATVLSSCTPLGGSTCLQCSKVGLTGRFFLGLMPVGTFLVLAMGVVSCQG